MKKIIRKIIYKILNKSKYPEDISKENIRIYELVENFTMTDINRINALIDATKYIINNNISGSIVECGVWRGGSMMAVAHTLKDMGIERELYLYDTYAGMNEPTKEDLNVKGKEASNIFESKKISESSSDWCYCSLEEVKNNLYSTGYNKNKIQFIEGKVEDTIPKKIPDKIALLRLDTDWYKSTKHEMIHLFPLLEENGILILDDYGYWEGAKQAVDEYIKEKNIKIFLNRIGYSSGRLGVKT